MPANVKNLCRLKITAENANSWPASLTMIIITPTVDTFQLHQGNWRPHWQKEEDGKNIQLFLVALIRLKEKGMENAAATLPTKLRMQANYTQQLTGAARCGAVYDAGNINESTVGKGVFTRGNDNCGT